MNPRLNIMKQFSKTNQIKWSKHVYQLFHAVEQCVLEHERNQDLFSTDRVLHQRGDCKTKKVLIKRSPGIEIKIKCSVSQWSPLRVWKEKYLKGKDKMVSFLLYRNTAAMSGMHRQSPTNFQGQSEEISGQASFLNTDKFTHTHTHETASLCSKEA